MDDHYTSAQQREEEKFASRQADWRNGAIVYQVFVDRFAPPASLEAKQQHYLPPKRLRNWSELPTVGHFIPEAHVWSQEMDFWGGDLKSLTAKLDYLYDLEIDVLYLNPICSAFTNHKYDALDYLQISPEYGRKADLKILIEQAHKRFMKVVLDGVFNHVGRQSEIFQRAAADAHSPYRDWFYFGNQYSQGARLWANAHNLPELNWENPAVRDYIYAGKESVVRQYLQLGIDGWRLDVAFELGYPFLHELTSAAHEEKPGSLVVGEIWNYPKDWMPAMDAVMNFTFRQIILDMLQETTPPWLASEMFAKTIEDAGVEAMLKSWIVLDNHDTLRLNAALPALADQKLAQVLQFTLPGAPNLYYGTELGMQGGNDPENRAPMRWDLYTPDNEVFKWMKALILMHNNQRALQIGDYHKIISHRLVAFERRTEKVGETVLVLVNPTAESVVENVLVPDSKLMNGSRFEDLLGSDGQFVIYGGVIKAALGPKSALVLKPITEPDDGYSAYKRIE